MIDIFARHRVAANLLMVMMILIGLWAIRVMPSQLDPPATFPVVYVDVPWRGAGAEDMETLVTVPIEQQLRTIDGVHEVRSRTEIGNASIWVEFDYDADMTLGLDQVKQRVANVRNLPAGIEPPVVGRAIDREPVAVLQVTGPGAVGELIPIVRGFERELMRRGIEGVRYDGLPKEEIALLTPARRLHELGMTLDELAAGVARASRDVPAGTVGSGQGSRQLRSIDQKRDPYAFEALLVESGDRLVRLGDLADVERRPQRGQPLVTRDGQAAIEMVLWRATAADAYRADQVVDEWLEEVRPTLPDGVQVRLVQDIWTLLGAQLEMIGENAASGLALVIVMLLLFLNGRVGWWVMVGIPVSFLMALALFHLLFGYGISIIALIGFVMALGIVVDDAIVVGEDATTLYQNGASPTEAAIGSARRMWVPVATSSLTTLAAFIPLLLFGGPMGQIILTLPTVLLCIILASLAECFLILPAHLKHSLGKPAPRWENAWRARFDAGLARFRDQRFMPVVRRALDYPGATLCAAIGGMMIVLSLIASQHVGVALVTGFDFEGLEANVAFSATATDADKTDFLKHLETELAAVDQATGSENLLGWVTQHNLATLNQDRMEGEQYASIEANYAFEEHRTLGPAEFVERWRARIERPAFVEQLVVKVSGGQNNGEPDLSLRLSGDDLEALKAGAEELALALAANPGVANVVDDLPYGREQIIFALTPAGRSLGLSAEAVGAQLRAAYSGSRVQIFNENESEIEVRAMLPDAERDDLGRLAQFPIRTADGAFVPLGNVATLYNRRGIDLIRHTDGRLAVTVSADVDPQVNNALALTARLERDVLPDILRRHDLEFGLGGKSREDQVLLDTMAIGAVLTLVLIYLILTWVFASFLWPLAIMTAIPFGLTGAVLGHWITGWDIGAMSLLAFFSLTGVVVNDGIVLISFLQRRMEDGERLRPALEHAVRARFRAVLLTSLTTIAGLSPLMFETSTLAFYLAPIAVTLCFGLALATALVLIVIPALILLLEGARNGLARLTGREHPAAGSPARKETSYDDAPDATAQGATP
ncbi:MAG: efflux RND transporter permease subunit [Pseudomonadales bacterium]